MRVLPTLVLVLAAAACNGPEEATAPDTPAPEAPFEVAMRIAPPALGVRSSTPVIRLPTPDGWASSALAVNKGGVVGGWVNPTGDGTDWRTHRAVLWPTLTSRVEVDLGGLAGAVGFISDGGDLAGSFVPEDPGLLRSWLRRAGGPLQRLPASERIVDMNAIGTVLINRTVPGGTELHLMSSSGTRRTIGRLTGIALSDFNDILASTGTTYGVLRPTGAWTPLQVPAQGCRLSAGPPSIRAYDINIHRDVVGETICPGGFFGAPLAESYVTTWDASGAGIVHLFPGLASITDPFGPGGQGVVVNNQRVAALSLGNDGLSGRTALLTLDGLRPTLTVFAEDLARTTSSPQGISSGVGFAVGGTFEGPHAPRRWLAKVWRP